MGDDRWAEAVRGLLEGISTPPPAECQGLPPTAALQETADPPVVQESSHPPESTPGSKSSRPKNSMLAESFISQLSTLSVSALAAEVKALDQEFAAFASSMMENHIDGDDVIAFIKDEVLNAMFHDLGIRKQQQKDGKKKRRAASRMLAPFVEGQMQH